LAGNFRPWIWRFTHDSTSLSPSELLPRSTRVEVTLPAASIVKLTTSLPARLALRSTTRW